MGKSLPLLKGAVKPKGLLLEKDFFACVPTSQPANRRSTKGSVEEPSTTSSTTAAHRVSQVSKTSSSNTQSSKNVNASRKVPTNDDLADDGEPGATEDEEASQPP